MDNNLVNKTENNKSSLKGIYFIFLAIITIFTTVNAFEFFLGNEIEGRKLGLGKITTVQDEAVTIWGGIQKLAGKKLAFGSTVYEDVTILSNGTATMADQDASNDAAMKGALSAKLLAEDIGAEFLYVQVPGKERSIDEFPTGVIDYSISKYDNTVSALEDYGIDVIPMRQVIEDDILQSGNEWMDYFYNTDHHWRNNAAFLAYLQICNYMNEKGLPVNNELCNANVYAKELHEQIFLGTHGRMTGPLYTGLDDYELWLPLYENSYSFDVPSANIHKEGTFEECFVNRENLEHYSYDFYAYYAYLKEDYECIEIRNRDLENAAHIIIVRDSEAVPVTVFLAGQCSEIDVLDLRYMQGDNAISYIREKNPDMILYIFGTGYLGNENAMVLR